jgi:hypothetical protein
MGPAKVAVLRNLSDEAAIQFMEDHEVLSNEVRLNAKHN